MEFSPSELAVYVDLIAQTKGIYAAEEYFNQVEPVFDRTNTRAKNWPAFASIVVRILEYNKKNGRGADARKFNLRVGISLYVFSYLLFCYPILSSTTIIM